MLPGSVIDMRLVGTSADGPDCSTVSSGTASVQPQYTHSGKGCYKIRQHREQLQTQASRLVISRFAWQDIQRQCLNTHRQCGNHALGRSATFLCQDIWKHQQCTLLQKHIPQLQCTYLRAHHHTLPADPCASCPACAQSCRRHPHKTAAGPAAMTQAVAGTHHSTHPAAAPPAAGRCQAGPLECSQLRYQPHHQCLLLALAGAMLLFVAPVAAR